MKSIVGLLIVIFAPFISWGQALGDYRSFQSGPWNDVNAWERFNGASWINPAPSAPTSASGVITILAGHTINIPAGVSITTDQTTVAATGVLQIDATGTLTLANGAGNDLTITAGSTLDVSGTLINTNLAVISGSTSATTIFQSGGVFTNQYTTTQGVIPLAVWDAASTLNVTGYTTFTTATAAGNWTQSFGNVTWNCAAQTATFNLGGLLTTAQGNLDVLSSGTTGVLRFASTTAATLSVGGDFNVSGGTRVSLCTTGTIAINVAGNYTQNLSAGYVRMVDGGTGGVGTLNLTGNFNLQAGLLTETGADPAQGNINFVGTAGTVHTFTEAGTPTATLTQRLSYSVAADNDLTTVGESQLAGGATSFFTLGTNAILRLESTDAAGAIQTGTGQGAATGNLRVNSRVYNAGSQIIYDGAAAQFMGNGQPLVAGVTTVMNNSAGVTQVAASTLSLLGNLALQTGNLTVSNASLTVSGTTDMQAGDILFTSIGTARTLTFTGNVNLGGNIVVTSGTQNANLIINGDISGGSVVSFSGVNSNVIINGTGDLLFPLAGTTDLETLTCNRVGTLTFNEILNVNANATSLLSVTAGNVTVNADINGRGITLTNGSGLLITGNTILTNTLTITNGTVQTDGTLAVTNDIVITAGSLDANGSVTLTDDLTLGAGTTFFFEDQTVTFNSQINNSGGVFSSNSSSTLNVAGAGIFGTIAFSPSGNTLGFFTLNRTAGGTLVTLNSPLTVTGNFNLLDGGFLNTSGLDFGSGAIVTRASIASFVAGSAIPTGGPYDLFLTGVTMTTGVETQGPVQNVTSTASGTVTLGAAMVATGNLTISSGTFTSGANAVSVVDLTNNGTTFNAPSTTLSISGDLLNNGAFVRNNGTVDFSGTSTISGSVNPTFQNVTISGTLTSPTTLNITGNFTNNGVFAPGTGTVVFTNTANSTKLIAGTQTTTFNNITIQNNTSNPDVSINGTADLVGILTLASNSVLDADGAGTGVLTLQSGGDSPTLDASIATLPAGAQVTGNVTVERFMAIEGASGGRIYRYISSPVQNAPVSDMQAEIVVTGTFTGTSVCPTCGVSQTMFLYNETVITDTNGDAAINLSDGYEDFPANANTETFAAGRGYAMFVRGNLLTGNALWNLRGPINQGNVTPINFSPTYASSGVPANDGWNLVGNPYPSTIDWNAAAGWSKTNVSAAIQVRDNGTGVFATWNGVTGTNGGSRYIPTGQAFWIQTTGAPTLTANENVKVAGQQTIFFKEASLTDLLRITMVKGALRDETVIHFREDAQAGFDPETDARKFANSIFNLSSVLSTGEVLAINSAPFICAESVKLNVANAAVGTYQLEFSQLESFGGDVVINLTDKFLNQTIEISATTASYTFSITSNPASTGTDRFTVAFSAKALADEIVLSSTPVCENENAVVSIQNPEAGVRYQVLKNGIALSEPMIGNGTPLEFVINKDSLDAGINNIGIEAFGSRCLNTKLYPGTITVNEKPTTETIEGSTCKEGTIKLTAVGSAGTTNFMWYDAHDSETVLSMESEFTTPVISKSRTYYVSSVSTSGCISERVPVAANVIQYEDVTVIQTEAGLLESSYTIGNKWFFNDVEIAGQTSNTITPEESGTYKVEVIQEGCSSTAEYQVLLITGTEDQSEMRGISIYPNPVTDKAYIEVLENKVDIRKAVLYSSMGNVISDIVFVKEGDHKRGIVDMDNLPPGVYMVRLFTPARIVTLKVLKK